MNKPEIRILEGLAGARAARGVAVIIDVFRAFSLAPWALARGARCVVPVATAEEAFAFREREPGCLLAGEYDGRQVDGFDFGNSPADISRASLADRVLVHRTGAGVQGLLAAENADAIVAASFLTARATAEWLRASGTSTVSLVAMGWNGHEPALEDQACAVYLAGALAGSPPDFPALKRAIRDDPTGQRFFDPALPWFTPEDFEACLDLDRFGFAVVAKPDPDFGLCLMADGGVSPAARTA